MSQGQRQRPAKCISRPGSNRSCHLIRDLGPIPEDRVVHNLFGQTTCSRFRMNALGKMLEHYHEQRAPATHRAVSRASGCRVATTPSS
eukprot:6204423-Pleurochrysis_carterae.AAC.2